MTKRRDTMFDPWHPQGSPYARPANSQAMPYAPEPPPEPTWWDNVKMKAWLWWVHFRTPKTQVPFEIYLFMWDVKHHLAVLETRIVDTHCKACREILRKKLAEAEETQG